MQSRLKTLAFLLLFAASFCVAQNVSPIGAIGSLQVFDNNGNECTACVLYTYQGGTTTQQATYTDSTGTQVNTDPVAFGAGARASIWLTTGAYYKLVLCLQNDGAFCAPSDVLYSQDQVLGGSSGGSGGGSPFTGTFISGSANPASSGIIRMASGDSMCWRNAAGTANLCLSKDSSDILTWAGNTLKLAEGVCAATGTGYDFLCASSSVHRPVLAGSGGTYLQIAVDGAGLNANDQVQSLTFGSATESLCSTAPTTNQYLQWTGTCIGGAAGAVFNTTNSANAAAIGAVTMTTAPASDTNYIFTIYSSQTVATVGCSGQPNIQVQVNFTDAFTNASRSLFGPNETLLSSLGSSTVSTFVASFRAKASTAVTYQVGYGAGTGCSNGGSYAVAPDLQQQQ